MPFNGSGTFSRTNGVNTGSTAWQSDRDTGVNIVVTRHDAHDQDIANGLTNCVTKDGQTTRTADSPMGGYKHTNVGSATARSNYATAGQVQDGALMWGGTSGGSANAQTVTLTPAPSAIVAGMTIRFRSGFFNSGATTLNVNGLGATNITSGTRLLIAGELATGYDYTVVFNGTSWSLQPSHPSAYVWTPTSPSGGGLQNITAITVATGMYSIDRSVCHIRGDIQGTFNSTVSNTLNIGGLPITVSSRQAIACYCDNLTSQAPQAIVPALSATVQLMLPGANWPTSGSARVNFSGVLLLA
ncbi:MAG: hypothetical protein E6Q97_00830 [Desulfurellales bacterium]|nr:MAG: hypothetical protein E6Q97_00830 [Desulfurellales bacterium]